MNVSKIQCLLTVTVIAVVGLCRTADAGEISAKAISVSETRIRNYVKKPKTSPPSFSRSNRLYVRIQFSGSVLVNATHRRAFNLKTVTSNDGNSLKLKAAAGGSPSLNSFFRMRSSSGTKDDTYVINVSLSEAKRSAISIAELNGEIKFRIATKIEELTIPLSDLVKDGTVIKSFQNVELKKLNLDLTRRIFSISPNGTTARVMILGEGRRAVFAVSLVDQNGKLAVRGRTAGSSKMFAYFRTSKKT